MGGCACGEMFVGREVVLGRQVGGWDSKSEGKQQVMDEMNERETFFQTLNQV